jgi:hypothetical protein
MSNKLIKDFNLYFDKIEEALQSSKDINWDKTNNSLTGLFEVNNTQYKIKCLKQVGNNWTFSFYYLDNNNDWSIEMKNDGINSFKVLPTIQNGIKYLYNITKPNSIIFSAIDSNENRKGIYLNFCKSFCDEIGFKFSNRGNNDLMIYVLFDDNISDIDKDDIMYSVKKIIEIGK